MSKVIYEISKLLIDDDAYDADDADDRESSDNESFFSQSQSIRDIENDDDSNSTEEEDSFEEENTNYEAINESRFMSPIRSSLFTGGDLTIRFLKENEIGI